MLEKIKNFFKTKKVGFYLTAFGAILLYVVSIVYTVAFRNIQHAAINYSIGLSLIPLITFLAVGVLLVFEESATFARAALLIGQFLFLLLFANSTYIYLSDYFFEMSSIGDFFKALKGLDSGYIAVVVLILITFVIGLVSLFFKVSDAPFEEKMVKTDKTNKAMLISGKVLTYVMIAIFGLTMVGGQIALDNSSAINTEFHIPTQQIINPVDEEHPEKYIYYKSNFTKFDDVLVSGKQIARESVAEGATLLLNNNVLPFEQNTGVSLFGATSVFPALSGTGSGAWVDSVKAGSTLFKDGFEQAGLRVNPDLFNFYKTNSKVYCRVSAEGVGTKVDFTIGEAPWSAIKDVTESSIENYKHAIFIVGRQGGEGKDLKMTTGDTLDMSNGNYLTLSPKEIEVLTNLKTLKSQNKIEDITVIINSAYQVCGFDQDYGIDAMIWSGSIGTYGTYAIGDILTGKVNPSGRLSDTFWMDYLKNPANYNFGDFTYKDRIKKGKGYDKYVVYQEGMYMGYRYAETRYEDKVLGRANVGTFDYYDTVEFPFGYGLSYSNFAYSDFTCEYNALLDEYYISVKVTNTSDVKGKEIVQLYLSKPYTEYDIANHIEIPTVGLIDYGKTDLLDQNESQVITFKVPRRELASYDAYNKKTYILEAGDFMFTVGKDAHDAANNILIAKGKTTSDTVAQGNTGFGDASLVKTVNIKENDYKKYSKSLNGTDIKNAFDTADIKIFEPNGENKNAFEWTTRNNWADTIAKAGGVSLKRTSKMDAYYEASLGSEIKPDETPQEKPVYGEDNDLQLIDLRAVDDGDSDPTNDVWIEFDDPLWEKFLNQLTWEESVTLLSKGQRHTEGLGRLGKPETLEHNGGVGFKTYDACTTGRRLASDSDVKGYRSKIINYPCNGIVASTFNKDLTYKMGVQWGEDALWTGHNMLYGPGNNLHRSAYNGRNFEYYSEDPILTGYECRVLDEGMATKGAYAYLKHCVLNEQESFRQECINTWCPEQAIRELYLKAFQIPIENGPITGVMTGFDGLGPVWTSSQGFCKQVLHGEFGMKGVAVSDYIGGNEYMKKLGDALIHGGDLPDGEVGFATLNAYKNNFTQVEWAMRESIHYIMYQTVHTNVMNGITPNTRMIELTPTWVKVIQVGRIVSGVLLFGSVGLVATSIVLIQLDKPLRKAKKEEEK